MFFSYKKNDDLQKVFLKYLLRSFENFIKLVCSFSFLS
jgi:hypothetical protein